MKTQNIYSVIVYDEWAKDQGEKLKTYLKRISPKIYDKTTKAPGFINYLVIRFTHPNLIKNPEKAFIQKLEKALKEIPIIKNHSVILPGTNVKENLRNWISKNTQNNSKIKLKYLNDFNPGEGFIGYHLKTK